MSAHFMHVGRFVVKPQRKEDFVALMRGYQDEAKQSSLDHAHLIEAEHEPGLFWYVTLWSDRSAWEAVEGTEAHRKMHADREPMLAQPVNQNFGQVIV